MKFETLLSIALVISLGASAQGEAPERTPASSDYVTSQVGPWRITTVGDDKGKKFILFGRENWGSVGMESLLGPRNITIMGKSPPPNVNQMISVKDSDNDGEFDVIEISNYKPEFDVLELRFIDGTWQMKTKAEWHAEDKSH